MSYVGLGICEISSSSGPKLNLLYWKIDLCMTGFRPCFNSFVLLFFGTNKLIYLFQVSFDYWVVSKEIFHEIVLDLLISFWNALSLDILHLQYFQVTCGAELAILFVETLVKGKFPYDDNTLGQSSLWCSLCVCVYLNVCSISFFEITFNLTSNSALYFFVCMIDLERKKNKDFWELSSLPFFNFVLLVLRRMSFFHILEFYAYDFKLYCFLSWSCVSCFTTVF